MKNLQMFLMATVNDYVFFAIVGAVGVGAVLWAMVQVNRRYKEGQEYYNSHRERSADELKNKTSQQEKKGK